MKLIVNGMSCNHCIKSITQAILAIAPKAKVDVDLAKKEVSIEGDISLEHAIESITDAGFDYVGPAK